MDAAEPKDSLIDDEAIDNLRWLGGGGAVREAAGQFRRQGRELVAAITEAYQAGDSRTVFELAHKLKGSCYIVGALKMAKVCATIEEHGRHDRLAETGEELLRELGAQCEVCITALAAIAEAEEEGDEEA